MKNSCTCGQSLNKLSQLSKGHCIKSYSAPLRGSPLQNSAPCHEFPLISHESEKLEKTGKSVKGH